MTERLNRTELGGKKKLELYKVTNQYSCICHLALFWKLSKSEKILMLGKIEGWRRRGRQRMRWLDGITNSMDMSLRGVDDGHGEGSGTPLQYSCLENPMDRGAWRATVHGVAKEWDTI